MMGDRGLDLSHDRDKYRALEKAFMIYHAG